MSGIKKARYRQSTPVGRLAKNVDKILVVGSLVHNRLASWSADGGEVAKALDKTTQMMQLSQELKVEVDKLLKQGFVPPKKSMAFRVEEGQLVTVSPKHRQRYAEAFEKELTEDPNFLNELQVVKIISSGEITVRRGKRTPFIVRKSHLDPLE